MSPRKQKKRRDLKSLALCVASIQDSGVAAWAHHWPAGAGQWRRQQSLCKRGANREADNSARIINGRVARPRRTGAKAPLIAAAPCLVFARRMKTAL
jgi:hypothetical protein